MSHPPDRPLDPADIPAEVRAQRLRVDEAMREAVRAYERDFPDWKRGVLLRVLSEALQVLRDLCEEGESEAVSYDSPVVEIPFPAEWDPAARRIVAARLSDDDIYNPEALLRALVARCNVVALFEATGGLVGVADEERSAPYAVPAGVLAVLEQIPGEARERCLDDARRRPFRVGGFLEPVYLDTKSGASIPSQEILRLEETLTGLLELILPRATSPDLPTVGVTFSVWPVVVRPWSDEEPRVSFPVQVALHPTPNSPPLSAWAPEERADWWRRLIDGLREVSLRLSGGAPIERRRTFESSPPPPERRSSMAPVPMPRQAARNAAAYDLTRGLGRMFSGLRKIPDLDYRDEIACAEAERLFWEIARTRLDEAVAAGRLSSWTKPESTPGELVLRGISEKHARVLWEEIRRATLKGAGGPGLAVAEPEFAPRNRHEGGEVVVETRVVLWPDRVLRDGNGRKVAPIQFRTEASPGYVAILERHGAKPFRADGWVWIPRGKVREGFRIGGLPDLLFPEGRAAIERIKTADAEAYERRLADIFARPSLFQDEDARVRQGLEDAIQRARAWVERISVYDIGPDLYLCIFEAFYRQRDDWFHERVRLPDGRVVETKPTRVLCLDPADLRLRLDPRERWGRNWRARLGDQLKALTTLQRETRTKDGKTVESGDHFLRRVIDCRDAPAGPNEGAGALVSTLSRAGAVPGDLFFVEVSHEFMEALVKWTKDEKGVVHWGLDAARATKRLAEARGDTPAEVREKTRQTREQARARPYYDHSPRMQSFGNAEDWPATRKRLAQALRQEETPNVETYRDRQGQTRRRPAPNRLGGKRVLVRRDGRDFVACAGSLGRGYTVEGWLRKVEYERRPGRGGSRGALEAFAEDLEVLSRSLELRVELRVEGADRVGPDALSALRALATKATDALSLHLSLLIPANLEEMLEDRLRDFGILDESGSRSDTLPRSVRSQGLLAAVDIKVARTRAGLTQEELASRIGVSQGALATWERGTKPIPRDRQEVLRAFVDEVNRTPPKPSGV